jgi:hypothetical protein
VEETSQNQDSIDRWNLCGELYMLLTPVCCFIATIATGVIAGAVIVKSFMLLSCIRKVEQDFSLLVVSDINVSGGFTVTTADAT